MKINTTLAIALLITGSSLYADSFYGHGPVKDRQERKEQRRKERQDEKERREQKREHLKTHKMAK